ncbi:MAG: diphthine synthase [Candidatus Aramenus sulfurataquae]|uniref:Diphthine synthase n=4 Tax=Candidatus Aramenus sulfurataquae TaxID=1326980 RepID=W7KWM6_9CREN|nr:MAG: diphthine synthase [Candidatus Aramenus sulfurataquae]MCL7344082.1 diphthine synthase [Candidatus Aramenus sulfurataquae]
MSYLYLVGLGLSKRFLTKKAMDYLKDSDLIYFDTYTSFSCDLSAESLEELIGKRVIPATRALLETGFKEIMSHLESGKNVAIASVGDPVIATTHVSLAVEAKNRGHEVVVVPGVSVHCYIISKSMLSSYKFGRSVTVVYPYNDVIDYAPYYVVKENREHGLHTIVYLDVKDGKFMDAREALTYLMKMEEKRKENVISREDVVVVGQRLGCDDEKVIAKTVKDVLEGNLDLSPPPHIIIIPARNLHYMEVEALKCLH